MPIPLKARSHWPAASTLRRIQTAKDEVIARRTKTRRIVDALAETPDGGDKARIIHFKGPEEAIDGALIGFVKKIHARVDAIREGGVGALHTFSRKFISA